MTPQTTRTALVVGSGDPADSVGVGLVAAGWSLLRLGDDLIDDDTVAAAFPTLEHLDLVVHARYPPLCRQRMDLTDLTAEQWHAACDEPLEAGIRLARAAYEPLRAAGGTIVYLVPLMASAGGDGFAPFAGAAEGLRVLAKSLARTWGTDDIRVHAITLDPSAFLAPTDAAGMAEANSLHDPPLGRVPDLSDEVSLVVDALTTNAFAALTGASLVVDGGLWMPG
ncbi:MAG: SDR family oxidoreductase [Acidimicrobiaceae bacterium]|nr:SDR family oxidoreductase [Acidimicrobiaceae bacterium]